jgi:hypothetical protein
MYFTALELKMVIDNAFAKSPNTTDAVGGCFVFNLLKLTLDIGRIPPTKSVDWFIPDLHANDISSKIEALWDCIDE